MQEVAKKLRKKPHEQGPSPTHPRIRNKKGTQMGAVLRGGGFNRNSIFHITNSSFYCFFLCCISNKVSEDFLL